MIPPEIEAVALLGWAVYPCSRTSKHGAFKGSQAAATSDLNQISRWSKEYRNANWRVVFGRSGIWGLDVDAAGVCHCDDGMAAMAALVKVHGPLPPGPRARSGSGGVGLFFRHAGERIVGESGQPAPGIDPRRGAQTQTIPPSIHIVTRRPYRWLVAPWEVAPPLGPAWLLTLLRPPPPPPYRRVEIATTDQARRRLYRAAFAVMDAQPGTRNDTLNRRGYQIGRLVGAGLLDEREAVDALYAAARDAGLDHAEIRETIHSAISSGRRVPMEIPNG